MHLIAPEILINPKARAKMAGIVNKVYREKNIRVLDSLSFLFWVNLQNLVLSFLLS